MSIVIPGPDIFYEKFLSSRSKELLEELLLLVENRSKWERKISVEELEKDKLWSEGINLKEVYIQSTHRAWVTCGKLSETEKKLLKLVFSAKCQAAGWARGLIDTFKPGPETVPHLVLRLIPPTL